MMKSPTLCVELSASHNFCWFKAVETVGSTQVVEIRQHACLSTAAEKQREPTAHCVKTNQIEQRRCLGKLYDKVLKLEGPAKHLHQPLITTPLA
jgi:hypothetical protein